MASAETGHEIIVEIAASTLTMTNEVLASLSATVWEVSTASRSVLDPRTTITVEVTTDAGATWNPLTAGQYTIRHLAGRVTLDASVGAVDGVRISGDYFARHAFAKGSGIEWNRSRNLHDSTVWQQSGRTRTSGLVDGSATVSTFQIGTTPIDGAAGVEKSLDELTTTETLVVLTAQFDPDTPRMNRMFAKLADHSISSEIDGLVEGSLEFTGTLPTKQSQMWDSYTQGVA